MIYLMGRERKHTQTVGFSQVNFADRQSPGTFKNGIKEGQGKLKFPDGSQYVGRFKEDMLEGYGVLTYLDGRVYEGQWSNNMKHGKGVFDWPDGKKDREDRAEIRRLVSSGLKKRLWSVHLA